MARYGQEFVGRAGRTIQGDSTRNRGGDRGLGSDVGGRNDLPNRPDRGGMGGYAAESSRGDTHRGGSFEGRAQGGMYGGGGMMGRGYDRDFGSTGVSGRRYGAEYGAGRRGGFIPGEYDRDLGDRLRSGWSYLRRNVRQTFGRGGGYDRNW
jgi:hypothetical protein